MSGLEFEGDAKNCNAAKAIGPEAKTKAIGPEAKTKAIGPEAKTKAIQKKLQIWPKSGLEDYITVCMIIGKLSVTRGSN